MYTGWGSIAGNLKVSTVHKGSKKRFVFTMLDEHELVESLNVVFGRGERVHRVLQLLFMGSFAIIRTRNNAKISRQEVMIFHFEQRERIKYVSFKVKLMNIFINRLQRYNLHMHIYNI